MNGLLGNQVQQPQPQPTSAGLLTHLAQMLGIGPPAKTVDLQPQYQKYASALMEQGQEPLKWPEWLQQNGYTLSQTGQVIPMPQQMQQTQQPQGLLHP